MKWSDIDCPDRVYGKYDENERIVRGFFLHSIGLDLENLPEEIFEKCELFDAHNINHSKYIEQKVFLKDIVGTTRTEYSGKTWVDAFIQGKRHSLYIMENMVTKNKFFHMLKKHTDQQSTCIELLKTKDGNYYVFGNGNHRITLYKLMYLADCANGVYRPDLFWLYAEVCEEL